MTPYWSLTRPAVYFRLSTLHYYYIKIFDIFQMKGFLTSKSVFDVVGLGAVVFHVGLSHAETTGI